ncbi:glutamate-5-semialdehyde dehydrogenase [Qipengyuania sp. JC766]|uniref:glutamate-5-semialdehyde dehydrogenase n=1 Tax=Qipengyuania sp. JC766 TaxID=3232139 RepID=UPI00345A4279
MNDMSEDPTIHVHQLGRRAREATRGLLAASTDAKNAALRAAAKALRDNTDSLLEANAKDVAGVEGKKPDSFVDRLRLTEDRVEGMAAALEQIAELPDPVGRQLAQFDRPNGLKIERVAVPIGVVGMIYESRPNVGADASALCLKSGNAVILRGGSESRHSTRVIVECMRKGLAEAGLPEDAVQTVGTTDRAAVAALLTADEFVDLVIPRGGRGLVELVRDQASVPTLLHLDGNCHSYVHEAADLDKAAEVIRNAKLRRTGVCGATESIVVDRAVADDFVPRLAEIMGSDCELRGDETAVSIDDRIKPATDEDWDTEYLDPIASVKIVEGLDEAIAWVDEHSSHHTDAIMTEDDAAARRFMTAIDSAIVMHNASTQFADGGEFGMGAEIGIATGKMHARGPVGLEQLTSFKYLVHGQGQTRP